MYIEVRLSDIFYNYFITTLSYNGTVSLKSLFFILVLDLFIMSQKEKARTRSFANTRTPERKKQ